jgi:hypothetical protein
MRIFGCLFVAVAVCSCSGSGGGEEIERVPESARIEFQNFDEKISYCIGLDHAAAAYSVYAAPDVKANFDMEQVEAGMVDYLMGNELRIPV